MKIIIAALVTSSAGLIAMSSAASQQPRAAAHQIPRTTPELPYRVVLNPDFVAAQRRNDVVVMRRFLAPTRVIVRAMEPQNSEVCQPPVGTPSWAWIPNSPPATGFYWGGVCLPMTSVMTDGGSHN